jgi:spore coat assembly protein SafA
MKHTVRRGDTLYKIAKHHGTTVHRLIRKNPQIFNPNLIYPGQRIRVH